MKLHSFSLRFLILLAALAQAAYSSPARAGHLNGELMTFNDGWVPYEWGFGSTDTFSGILHPEYDEGAFLGRIGEGSVGFNGMDLFTGPLPSEAYLSFDLILFGDWRGNETGSESAFSVTIGTEKIFDSTFSTTPQYEQTYPNHFAPGSYPGTTGALLTDVLFDGSVFENVAVYHLDLSFDLAYPEDWCCGDVWAEFGAEFSGTPASWGLDNVMFSTTPIPEPGTALLVMGGLLLLASSRRSSR